MNSIKLRFKCMPGYNYNNIAILYLNEDILNIIPNIHTFKSLEQLKDFFHNINSYLHNESGPALINNGVKYYFINGQRLSKEEFNKHLHNKKFSDKLNLIID